MRRVIGLSLVGLGTFLIVIAVVLPTFIVSQVVKFPLNEFETATLVANNASYFNATALTERSPVTLQATYTIKGDGAAGNSSTAVWNEFSYVYDVTNHYQVQLQSRTIAFDRKTAQLVQCCGESVDGKPTVQTGVLGYVFPMGAKKQTYNLFDITLDKQVPFVYTGTTTVDGVSAYVYTNNVPPTQIGTQTVPGSLINSTATSVVAPEYYSNHVIYDVDPVTGALINVNEHEQQVLYNPTTNTQALTLINADLVMTPASVTKVVGLDNNGRNELTLLQLILPIVFGVVGAVALAIGILMVRQRREDVEAGPTTPAPEQAAVPEATRANLVPGFDDTPEEPTAETASAAETAEEAPASAGSAEEAATEPAPEAAADASAEAPAAADGTAEAAAPAETAEAPPADTSAAPAETTEASAESAAAPAAPAQATAAPARAAAANGGASAAAPKRARRTTKPAAEPDAGAN